MNTEEFTFPIVKPNNVVHLTTVLPPLWRISSVNGNSDAVVSEQQNDGGHGRITQRKTIFTSFSQVEGEFINRNSAANQENEGKSEEEEEKMDTLWEDFNEAEIQSSSGSNSEIDHHQHHDHNNKNNCYFVEDQFEAAESECSDVREQEMSCGSLNPTKKKNVELVVKMLKKVFLLQNMAAINNKRGHN